MSCNSKKQKRITLSIEYKVNIIKLIEEGTSYGIISERYGIGKLKVCDIKKNEGKFKRVFTENDKDGSKEAR